MVTPRVDDARRFLYAEARLLERRCFAAVMGGASPRGALDALLGYRNDDGGFGHGLEPDNRAPGSQPLDVEVAFQVMDMLGRVDDEIVGAACRFLDGLGPGVSCLAAGALEYPRAPHWGTWALQPELNPTAGIAALLWKWGFDHPWRSAATAFCWAAIAAGLPEDAHSFAEALSFLAWVPDEERVAGHTDAIAERLGSLKRFRLDPSAPDYGITPLHLAPSPDSRWIDLFEPSTIEAHLDALVAEQGDDGGWPISWPTVGPAAEQECRGVETLRALRVLRSFGRIA